MMSNFNNIISQALWRCHSALINRDSICLHFLNFYKPNNRFGMNELSIFTAWCCFYSKLCEYFFQYWHIYYSRSCSKCSHLILKKNKTMKAHGAWSVVRYKTELWDIHAATTLVWQPPQTERAGARWADPGEPRCFCVDMSLIAWWVAAPAFWHTLQIKGITVATQLRLIVGPFTCKYAKTSCEDAGWAQTSPQRDALILQWTASHANGCT